MSEERTRAAPFNPCFVHVTGRDEAERLLGGVGADRMGVSIMGRKIQHLAIAVENVQARAAQLVKQEMLAAGGDCALPRDVYEKGAEAVSVIMMGTLAQFQRVTRKLSMQPFGLRRLAGELDGLLSGALPGEAVAREMRAGRYTLRFGGRTLVMGVLNVTPDSFSDGGEFFEPERARERALEMASAGADIIDIGGESTRPGSLPVEAAEELRRTVPLIRSIAGEVGVPVSIDTCKSEVAARALEEGASIINDVTGLRSDPRMAALAAERGVPVVIMHMQGTPRDMQDDPVYDDVVWEAIRFFRGRIEYAVEAGVGEDMIMVDPGIGFGKTVEHNLEILRRIGEFASVPCPLVLGTSRKRFIGAVLDRPVEQRLMGTAATVAFAIAGGVDVVRVHDVEEMADVVRMSDAAAGKSRPPAGGGG